MIFQNYKMHEVEGSILEFEDILAVEVRGENLKQFINDWDLVLTQIDEHPSPKVMESLFRKQVDRISELKETMALYNLGACQVFAPQFNV